jgi:hypothetical protein
VNAQQILGEQNPHHFVTIAIDDRKARVSRFDHNRDDFVHWVVNVDHKHLRPGNHYIGNAGVGGRQGAFDDGQRIGVHQVALVSRVQDFKQLLAVFRFAQEQGSQSFDKARSTGGVHNF